MKLRTIQNEVKVSAVRQRGRAALWLTMITVLALAVLVFGSSRAFAAPAPARFWIDRPYYEANARQHPMDVAPYVSAGRTYIPVRYLAYALGVPEEGVQWDDAAQTASLRKENVTLRLKPGSPLLERQAGTGPSVSPVMDVAPEARSGRVFLPARYVAAGLGYSAAWDPATREVTLAPGEIAWAEELVFDPNPAEPDKGLMTVIIRSKSGGESE